jgi:hypothetical protein
LTRPVFETKTFLASRAFGPAADCGTLRGQRTLPAVASAGAETTLKATDVRPDGRRPALPGEELDGLVLLVPRDPDWALVLWELGADAVGSARAQLAPPASATELQLRLYPLGDRPGARRRAARAYPLANWVGERLVLIERPGLPHQAVIGFVDGHGAFVAVARSEVTPTPQGGYAPGAERGPTQEVGG